MENEKSYNSISQKGSDTILAIRLTPNSSKNELVEINDEFLKIKISAPPIENKANKELILFLSDTLKIPKSRIEFCFGEKSKLKRILIKDTNSQEITKKILFMLN